MLAGLDTSSRCCAAAPRASLVNETELDWPNIAEAIESLGKAAAREFANRVSTILIHLMNLAASPAIDPRIGWFGSSGTSWNAC